MFCCFIFPTFSGIPNSVETIPKSFENRSKIESKIMHAKWSLEPCFSKGFGDPKTGTDGGHSTKNCVFLSSPGKTGFGALVLAPRTLFEAKSLLFWAPQPIVTASLRAIRLCVSMSVCDCEPMGPCVRVCLCLCMHACALASVFLCASLYKFVRLSVYACVCMLPRARACADICVHI